MRQVCVWLGVVLTLLTAESGVHSSQAPVPGVRSSRSGEATRTSATATPAADISSQRALLDKYCVTCHNQTLRTAGLALDTMDLAQIHERAETWEKVLRKLRGGMMPPQGMPRPDAATLEAFATGLETSLDREGMASPNPGRASLHRLNRTEYANAIRDLLALEIDVTSLLPADDEGYGFDNIADVLKVSPSLLEQYLAASYKVSSLAVGDPSTPPISDFYRIPPDLAQDEHIEGLPLGTRGGALIRHNFPLDADYQFSVKLLRNIVGYMTGLEFAHQLEISVDGERVFIAPVGGPEDNLMSDENMSEAADKIDERLKTRIPIKAGPRTVGVTFLRKSSAESDEPLQPFTRDHDLQNMNGIPLVDYVDIRGPFEASGPGDTPSRRRIFVCRPSTSSGRPERAEGRPVMKSRAPERSSRRWLGAPIGGRSPTMRSRPSSPSTRRAGKTEPSTLEYRTASG